MVKNIFTLHKEILDGYKSYIDSFINISDQRIKDVVVDEFQKGRLYPEPLVQFNPSFESGGPVSDLVNEGVLSAEFNDIYYDETGKSWSIYKHQTQALRKGNQGKGFIVTSGTGSGKSLTYISTILNSLFKSPGQPGIKAIIVYPLNALINSQIAALDSFNENYKKRKGRDLPVTYAKYTGQEPQAKRDEIVNNPPDILLTNYMMLELLMVRKSDERVRNSFLENLKFLVFDELHVYKGRQGADVSLLNRRIKAGCNNKNIICIGTSATMASGSVLDQQKTVAEVASRFFNANFESEDVIVESLSYSTAGDEPSLNELKSVLDHPISKSNSSADLAKHPLAIWLERNVAIETDNNGNKVRRKPKSLKAIAEELAKITGTPRETVELSIIELLSWAEKINVENARARKKDTILPFKLHQFISQTGFVYLTLQKPDERHITLNPNPFVKLEPGKPEVQVFETVFSRISGQEFLCVRKSDTENGPKLTFRSFNENKNPRNDEDLKLNDGIKVTKKSRQVDEYKDGYIIFEKAENLLDLNEYIDILPSAWKTKTDKIVESKAMLLPKELYVALDGSYSDHPFPGAEKAWFIPAPLIFDPTCGLIYQETKLSEKTKLLSLGNEGRSTSTTLITLQTLIALHNHGKPLKEQKLMSFTDNRQDASLQAGHFNDFVQVVHLRSALEKVLRDAGEPLDLNSLIYKVERVLNLNESDYAQNPSANPDIPNESNKRALRKYITYRIIQDLKRGWRYILPNLEQTALLKITYQNLDQYAENKAFWAGMPLMEALSVESRKDFILQVLNYFRSSYAVDYEILRYDNRAQNQDELNNILNKDKLWSLDRGEKLEAPAYLSPMGSDKGPREAFVQSIGPASRLGKYIKRNFRKMSLSEPGKEEYEAFISVLLDKLEQLHFLRKENIKGEKGARDGYQLILSTVLWEKGDGKNVQIDKTSFFSIGNEIEIKPHKYFQELYTFDFSTLPKSYLGAEHTGQISNELKIAREQDFNDAQNLSALFCSPTMELGIDISSLNIVHMRNIPPSPANYAQRSGRAGRSGQSALVFAYASKISPHDKHYFDNPVKMVSGIVQAPRIDLTNEELIRSHINATVLSFLNAEEFGPSLTELVDIEGGSFQFRPNIKAKYQEVIDSGFEKIYAKVMDVVNEIGLSGVGWFNEDWLRKEVKTVPDKLEHALSRWIKMYLEARRQMNEAHETKINHIIKDPSIKKDADRSYWLAENRIKLLLNRADNSSGSSLSEFYTFRYLASEGFLPGYNFTRLPIRVFLGSRDKNESVSRPRFIGLEEFGPNNFIYHNGSKYKVNRVTPSDVSLELSKIKISSDTNYAYLNDEGKGINQDPITEVEFTASNLQVYNNLLELKEAQSESVERISCMEETRAREGYDCEFYFNTADNLIEASKIKLTIDEAELMKLFYAPSARIIKLNKGWKRGITEGYDIGSKSGFFKTKKQTQKPNPEDPPHNIMLYTSDTSDVLYIQPIKSLALSDEAVVTMQYAMQKAIELCYNIEPVEVSTILMGKSENRNIMVFESAEGSIGVLKDIARNPVRLKDIFHKAYEICGYDYNTREDKYPERPKASYDDLLSYYNQADHLIIDRHSIIKALELLITSNPDNVQGITYEERYRELLDKIHHRSPGEKIFLDHLFENGICLPDYTNHRMEEFYIEPDFVYKEGKVLIFVDGGVHKKSLVKADDDKKRMMLKNAGFDVLSWDETSEAIDSFIARRQDVFRKVR